MTAATHKFANDHGVYLCFNEFQYEENFPQFLSELSKQLNVSEPDSKQGPYSITAELEYCGESLIVMFHENTGCCVMTRGRDSGVIDKLELLYAVKNGSCPKQR